MAFKVENIIHFYQTSGTFLFALKICKKKRAIENLSKQAIELQSNPCCFPDLKKPKKPNTNQIRKRHNTNTFFILHNCEKTARKF